MRRTITYHLGLEQREIVLFLGMHDKAGRCVLEQPLKVSNEVGGREKTKKEVYFEVILRSCSLARRQKPLVL